jgi:hypothetical protein
MNNSRRSFYIVAALISVIGLIILVELGSYVSLNYYVSLRDGSAFYKKPLISREDYAMHLRNRHPVLGWPSAETLSGPLHDSSGSRPIPSFPDPGQECVSTFGDSFTYGEEVEDEEAWSNILSIRLGCRVANFGVGGYGTDQALIRFLEQPKNSSRLVLLGIFPHDVRRNVNQYRYFLGSATRFGFKPRFILKTDELSLIPLPSLDYNELQDSLSNPAAYYPYDAFIPGSKLGPIVLSFPYSRSVLKYVTSERVKYYFRGMPSWSGFVSSGHSSGALEVTVGIVKKFFRTAEGQGKSGLVVTFPTPSSYEMFLETGVNAYQQLLDLFEAEGLTVMDLHWPINNYLGDRAFCDLLTDSAACKGHFNVEGNELVADILYKKIMEASLLSPE